MIAFFSHRFSVVVGFEVPNRFIVGYAIDYNDFFRDIPVSKYNFINGLLTFDINNYQLH